MVRETSDNVAKAGSDHDVLLDCVHPAAARLAVAPGGNPVTERTVATGSVVPAVGAMTSLYVAEPPGATACDVALPEAGDKLKPMTESESAPLLDAAKFVSPL